MTDDVLLVDHDPRGVVTLTLNKPDRRNAFDAALMDAIGDTLEELGGRDGIRALVLTGAGSAFSAGADLDWMSAMVDNTYEENLADSRRLDDMFRALDTFPRPVVAVVNGHALGGGMGLIACADIAVAAADAKLGFSEARVGLAPAVISSYVQPKIGVSAARRFFLTGEVFGADRARRIGLVHEVCAPEDLDATREDVLGRVLAGGPRAQAAIKALIPRVERTGDPDARAELTLPVIARRRVSEEGQEGMAAFFEGRDPAWVPQAER